MHKIAVIFDFDGTLIPGNMQDLLFKKRGVDPKDFWGAVEEYRTKLSRYSRALSYLNFLCDCINKMNFEYPWASKLHGISMREFYSIGEELQYYPGVEEFFREIYQLGVAIYVISCGLREIIDGCSLKPYINEVYACSLEERNGIIRPIDVVDPQTKIGIIYNLQSLPLSNVIVVADGNFDLPMLMYVKKNGGYAYLIGDTENSPNSNLTVLPPDYTRGSKTYEEIMTVIRRLK